jgi:hypothetical protein
MDENEAILRAAQYPPPKIWPIQNEKGIWQIAVPEEGPRTQIFMAPTLEGLCSKLGVAAWHATNKIRQQAADLNELRFGSAAELEAERQFAERRAQGLYDDF